MNSTATRRRYLLLAIMALMLGLTLFGSRGAQRHADSGIYTPSSVVQLQSDS